MVSIPIEISDERCRELESFMRRKRIEAGYERQVDAAQAIGGKPGLNIAA